MKIILRFADGISQVDLDALSAIQARSGALITFEKDRTVTTSQFAREHGMNPGSVSRNLHRPECPKITGKVGPKGRVVEFLATEEVRDFLLAHKRS